MPQPKNTALRVIVPIIVGIVGVFVVMAVFKNSGTTAQPSPASGAQSATTSPGQPGPAGVPVAQPVQPLPLMTGLSAEVFESVPAPERIGSLDADGPDRAEIEFSSVGAGIKSIHLTGHFDSTFKIDHSEIQTEHTAERTNKDGQKVEVHTTPLAALSIDVNSFPVSLSGWDVNSESYENVWRETSPGVFEAFIIDEAGNRIVRIERAYSLRPDSYDILLAQDITNLSDEPLDIRFYQYGPIELERLAIGYGGDKRRVRFGYLRPKIDPSRQMVFADEYLKPRRSALGPKDKVSTLYEPSRQLWPNELSQEKGLELAWAGMTNRYFGVAIHPDLDPDASAPDKRLHAAQFVHRQLLDPSNQESPMILVLFSEQTRVAPSAAAQYDLGIFAGPLDKSVIKEDTITKVAGLDGLVAYNFGGPCAICTFSWLTGSLIGLLDFLHDHIVYDWALAIIVLVLIVRTCLHPVTKWSQIRVQRFGKQMQGMAPKQKKLQERYAGDKKKLQEETAKLWREEGINPAGMLGCLPMFLQTPVWIALYATLYFAFELRHQPAFFGVFQQFGGWMFLSDLAEPDQFIHFGRVLFTIPMLGEIDSFNVLPIFLGIVFFIHQKYMTPPTAGAMTPEQESQQKMMKVMMVVMFPVIMYSAPSGLALYFITNSTLGIIESRHIRAHAEKHGLLDLEELKKKRKGKGGFLQRLQQAAQAQQSGRKGPKDPRHGFRPGHDLPKTGKRKKR